MLRILFDENVPAPLRRFFPGDQLETVQERGWAGIENGELLDFAEGGFDALVLAEIKKGRVVSAGRVTG